LSIQAVIIGTRVGVIHRANRSELANPTITSIISTGAVVIAYFRSIGANSVDAVVICARITVTHCTGRSEDTDATVTCVVCAKAIVIADDRNFHARSIKAGVNGA
jgi:hypothetical protein